MYAHNGAAAELLAEGQSVLVAVRPPQAVEQATVRRGSVRPTAHAGGRTQKSAGAQ